MPRLISPELSYKIIGAAFDVFNDLGYGLDEKFYQRAFAAELEKRHIHFEREKLIRIGYKDESIGNLFLDFLIDKKIVVELKVRPRLGYINIKQVSGYLKASGCELGILIYFTRDGVKYRRILNSYS